MAFEFLGTFNKSQYDRFFAYARNQLADIEQRINHLDMEISRIGNLSMSYEAGGIPTEYSVSSSTQTYVGALVAAYEALGGHVTYDLQVRSLDQAIVLVGGSEMDVPQFYSNGEIVPGRAQLDSVSANYMGAAKDWLQGTLTYKRDYLERKVRRSLDYVEQLIEEKEYLLQIQQDATAVGSLEYYAVRLQELIVNTSYTAIYDDRGADPHGKFVYAARLPYSRAGSTIQTDEPGTPGKDESGFVPAGVDGQLPSDTEGTGT